MKMFYAYEDWTTELSPRCFYVGKGDDDRIKRLKRGKYHSSVVKQYGQDRKIVFESIDETEALDEERRLIAIRHTHPHDPDYNGIGVNRTTGGQGNSGRIVTEETCRKISEAKKGKKPNKVWSQAERDATSKRMSLLHKGKKISEEQKEKLRKKSNDPIIKARMIEKVTIKIRDKYANDPEFVQKIYETRCRGEHHGCAKLTELDVVALRKEWDIYISSLRGATKEFCQSHGDRLGVTPEAIYGIIKRKTWRHLT